MATYLDLNFSQVASLEHKAARVHFAVYLMNSCNQADALDLGSHFKCDRRHLDYQIFDCATESPFSSTLPLTPFTPGSAWSSARAAFTISATHGRSRRKYCCRRFGMCSP